MKQLLIQYQAGTLPAAKSMLVEAHLHECVDCRHVAESGNRKASALFQRGNRSCLAWIRPSWIPKDIAG